MEREKSENKNKLLSLVYVCVCLCVNRSVMSDSLHPMIVLGQAPLFMKLSRRVYWIGMPFLSPKETKQIFMGYKSMNTKHEH